MLTARSPARRRDLRPQGRGPTTTWSSPSISPSSSPGWRGCCGVRPGRARASGLGARGTGRSRHAFGDYWVDFETLRGPRTRAGDVVLSPKEIAVMRLFLSRPNQVVTRRDLLAEVWQLPNHPNERVVDNVIVALRQAFEQDSSKPRHIVSVRGVGYRFVP